MNAAHALQNTLLVFAGVARSGHDDAIVAEVERFLSASCGEVTAGSLRGKRPDVGARRRTREPGSNSRKERDPSEPREPPIECEETRADAPRFAEGETIGELRLPVRVLVERSLHELEVLDRDAACSDETGKPPVNHVAFPLVPGSKDPGDLGEGDERHKDSLTRRLQTA